MLESNEDFIQRSIEQLKYELQESEERKQKLYNKKLAYEEIVTAIENIENDKEDKYKFSKLVFRREMIENLREEIELMEEKIGYYRGVTAFIRNLLNNEDEFDDWR